ncbi:hypothetical protein [Burkholderia ubonensis]|uniref:hypothetical protein n=1 Tax=Burkholderia ubonensis TaxID=101571 RepID=UPI000AB488F2|nr:hypothetical protein [Burkholderia ubonensis]
MTPLGNVTDNRVSGADDDVGRENSRRSERSTVGGRASAGNNTGESPILMMGTKADSAPLRMLCSHSSIHLRSRKAFTRAFNARREHDRFGRDRHISIGRRFPAGSKLRLPLGATQVTRNGIGSRSRSIDVKVEFEIRGCGRSGDVSQSRGLRAEEFALTNALYHDKHQSGRSGSPL